MYAAQTPDTNTWIFLVAIILIMAYSIWRRRRQPKTRIDVAIGLLSHINHNIKVMEGYLKNWQALKRFKSGNWTKYKDKMDFLDAETQAAVNESFKMITDFNQQIDNARKAKTPSYVAGMQVDKLRGPITKAKDGIVEWVRANFQTEMAQRRRRGIFG